MSSPVIVEEATADRLRDAALVLLDAARAAHAQNPEFVLGQEYIAEPYALAVQALFFADVWGGPYGGGITLDPARTCQRVRGITHGLGVGMGLLPRVGRALACDAAGQGLSDGLAQGIDARKALRR